ncbi:MAG TPA: protein kinase, partial [Gemmatimonadales bacterium]|nr:protein kinase [Gemmatimonadales bacterium]
REAETAAALQHPNIVSILRVGAAGDLAYIVMAYVDGGSLADRMARQGQLPFNEAVRVAREVASALAAAHRRGFLHRDVKPQNILLDSETGRALVVDFGIAGAVAGSQTSGPEDDRLTGFGMVVGTPRYMSPEQASGSRDLGPGSDLYALGIVFYEMLAGSYPYHLSNPTGTAAAHLVQAPIPLRGKRPDLPLAVELLVDRLLAKDPEKRMRSGDEVVQALDGLLSPTATSAIQAPPVPAGTRRRGFIAGAVLGVLLLAGFFMVRGRGGVPDGVDPRRSLLIGFFDTSQDRTLDWLRVGGVKLLAGQLQRWDDLRVVDAERLLDLARREGVSPDSQLSLDDARKMARAAGVWTVTVGSVFKFGDRISVEVKSYDVASGNELRRDSAAVVGDSALPNAFKELADRMLTSIGAPVGQLAGEDPPTRSIEAWAAYIKGIRERAAWHVDSAKASFARATTADPSFAVAWLHRSLLELDDAVVRNTPAFAAFADSALFHAAGRPERERELIQGYNDLVHSRFIEARQSLVPLVAKDSSNALAWQLLGTAWQYDMALDTARGRRVMAGSYARALRAYERALALDESDHTVFANVAQLYALVGSSEGAQIPAFLSPPAGDLPTVFNRIADAAFVPVYVADTVALIPAESISYRFSARALDSLRARARARAELVTRRWLAVAPNEGSAHVQLGYLAAAAQQYDSALADFERAERLGVPNADQILFLRLQTLASARRWGSMLALSDSIARPGIDSVYKAYSLNAAGLANALVIAGRLEEAGKLVGLLQADVGQRSPEIRRFMDASPDFFGLLVRSASGTITRADVRAASTAYRRGMGRLSGPGQERVRSIVRTPIRVAAATVGDTLTLAQWPQEGADTNWSLYAWAYAEAGDTARARRALGKVTGADTSTSTIRLWALARANEAVGRRTEALRMYERIDSIGPNLLADVDAFALYRARALPAAAALYEAQGDTARARERYQRFLMLWRKADPALQPEVELAQRALAAMSPRVE